MQFDEWLATQRMHQETVHGVDHRALACDPYQMSRYVLTQMHSALDTMETARMNVPSHGMHEETQRKAWEANRSSFVDNVVSMLGCVGSMLTAVGCTDEELVRRYTDKLGMDVALRKLAAAMATPHAVLPSDMWSCAVCEKKFPTSTNPYAVSGDTVPLCSAACVLAHDRPELVLVPAPDVSAVDLNEDEDEEDIDA